MNILNFTSIFDGKDSVEYSYIIAYVFRPCLSVFESIWRQDDVKVIHRKKKDGGCTYFTTIPCEPN